MHKINVSPNREDTRQQMQRNKLTKYQTTQRMRYSPPKKAGPVLLLVTGCKNDPFGSKGQEP